MGNDTQGNEEQMEMLLMTLEEVRNGICLFQSENQRKWVSLIQERFGKEKVIVHDIAEDDGKKEWWIPGISGNGHLRRMRKL